MLYSFFAFSVSNNIYFWQIFDDIPVTIYLVCFISEIIIIYEIVFLKKLTLPFCTHSMAICFEKTIFFYRLFF